MARQLKRRTILAAATAIAWLGVTPASMAANKPAVDRDTVVVAVSKEIGSLDALVVATGDSQRYGWQMFDTLYAFDKKGNMVPSLATGYTLSADQLEYRFTLRRDVKFHNGDVMTSADVKYSMERILDPAVKSTRRPNFAPVIDKVEIPDGATVVFRLKEPDGAFMNKLAGYLFIIPKKYTEALPNPEAFGRQPIATGPFKFVEQVVGQHVVLERFDDYFGEKPKVKRIIFRVVPEPSSRVNALLAGEVDIADGLSSSDIGRLEKAGGIDVMPTPIGSPLAVRLYSNDPQSPLSKRDVRLALNYAVDSNAIIKNILHGAGKPLTSYISSFYPYGADPDLKPYEFNPAKARELLKKAGYPNGFELGLYSASDMPKELAETVAAYWAAVGVKAKIQRIDYAAWSRLNNTHKSGPATIMQFSNAIYDPIHPIYGAASKHGTWSDYYNPEVEALIEKASQVADPKGRGEIFKQIGRILKDDGHAVLLTELYYVFGKNAALNWEPQIGIAWYSMRDLAWK
jgi:peptide/nickel transport system substrate-binding protein